MRVPCPGACGAVLDYKEVPEYSTKRQRSGKFCPSCGFPLDEESALADTVEMGPSSGDIHAGRVKAAKAFHLASSGKKD